jgi:hypothetical protein
MTRDAGLVTNCATGDVPLVEGSAGIQIHVKLMWRQTVFDTFQIDAYTRAKAAMPRDLVYRNFVRPEII